MTRATLAALLLAAPLAAPVAAPAQEVPALGPALGDVAEAARDLAGRVADHVLVADMLGRDVIGPDGEALGTLGDLVVLPGGNLVAAVVDLGDGDGEGGGGRIALPWDAAKAGVRAGEPVEVPFTRAEIEGDAALRDLSAALGL